MIERIRGSNVRLWVGLSLLAMFAVTALLGPIVAPYSPTYEKPVRYEGAKPVPAPEPPSMIHWFGKDPKGRDVLSLLLHGLKYTLGFVLVVSLLRVLLGGWIGVWLGMKKETSESSESTGRKQVRILSLTGLFGGIPTILLLTYLLGSFTFTLSFWPLVFIQGMVLIVLGIFPVASTIAEQTRELKNRLSVLVAKTMGATRGWLIRKHILPMLKETFVILYVQDMILVLNVLGQLSVFHIFLGGTATDELFPGYPYYVSKSFEWVGLIGQNKTWMIAHPYLVWVPLAAYFTLLLSFFLVAKGLELRWREMYSKYPYV